MTSSNQTDNTDPAKQESEDHCCGSDDRRVDWLLWGSGGLVLVGLLLFAASQLLPWDLPTKLPWVAPFGDAVADMMAAIWWGILLGILFVGLLSHTPRSLVQRALGPPGSFSGILRATGAGVVLDLCSHGILMVGMGLYQRGASIGQVIAFLIASPWNSLTLTLILIGLIGLPLTLAFIGLSLVIAIITGWTFEKLAEAGRIPGNPAREDPVETEPMGRQLKSLFASMSFNPRAIGAVLLDGLKESRMVLRWLLFGVVLASLIRAYVPTEALSSWFGPTLAGLGLTLLATTIIEVCSEGSTPLAAELVNRAGAPGNGFTFLMAGVATDYTEIMSIKETTRSWKIALLLPAISVPQVLVIGWLLNQSV